MPMTTVESTIEAELIHDEGDTWNITFNILDRIALYLFLALLIYVGLSCIDMMRVAADDLHAQYLRVNGYHNRYHSLDCINC